MYHPDLSVINSEGKLVLAVEIKSKLGTSSDWAAKSRRNLLVHGKYPRAKYFLIALPDCFYLWKEFEAELNEVPPSYQIDPSSILNPYFERADILPESLCQESFELIIAGWLQTIFLLQDREPPTDLKEKQSWIFETGLFEEIKDGRIVYERHD